MCACIRLLCLMAYVCGALCVCVCVCVCVWCVCAFHSLRSAPAGAAVGRCVHTYPALTPGACSDLYLIDHLARMHATCKTLAGRLVRGTRSDPACVCVRVVVCTSERAGACQRIRRNPMCHLDHRSASASGYCDQSACQLVGWGATLVASNVIGLPGGFHGTTVDWCLFRSMPPHLIISWDA
jgi:hypothetical protein